jgi:hypothetical protein
VFNMRIFVDCTVDGENKTIVVDNVDPNSDTIKVVKLKVGGVAAEQGINIFPPVGHQRLLWNGKVVNENGHQSLSDHGINEDRVGADTRLRLEPRLLLVEKCCYNREYYFAGNVLTSFIVDPNCETVDSIKQKIQLVATAEDLPLGSPKSQQLFYGNQELLEGHRMHGSCGAS